MAPTSSTPKTLLTKMFGIQHRFTIWFTALPLLAAPITKHPNIFGGLLTTGILAFSGTKYSTLAPFGGFAFIAAWVACFCDDFNSILIAVATCYNIYS